MTGPIVLILVSFPLLAGCGDGGSSAAIARSKGLIVFESNMGGLFSIYTISRTGRVRQLTNEDDASPTWSPDGRRILFVRTGRGVFGGVTSRMFYVMNSDSSGLHRLTVSAHHDDFPVWSPDAARIAFTRYLGDDGHDVYEMNADGSGERRVASAGALGPPSAGLTWAPDAHKIAFERHRGSACEITVVADGATGRRRLVAGGAPAWSPDGDKIAFQRPCGEVLPKTSVWVVDANGTGSRRITSGGDPVWSRDGAKIAFMRALRPQTAADIYVMNADGSNQHRLTKNEQTKAGVTWSQHGEEIAFAQTECCGTLPGWDLYVVDSDGAHLRRLTNNHSANVSPEWQPPPQPTG